jgi:hypothetical protein
MRSTPEIQPPDRHHVLKRLALAASLAALSLAAIASQATAAVTIGQLSPDPSTGTCTLLRDRLQPTVTSGNSYVVPSTGGVTSWTLTSWSTAAKAGAGQELAVKVFRKVSDPATYSVVGHEGPHPLAASALNTFPASIPVKAGDVLGTTQTKVADTACSFTVIGDSYLFKDGDLADGGTGAFAPFTDRRLNVTASLVPVNSFAFGEVKKNKKKGTATLTVDAPNAGTLALAGKGVKPASAVATAAGPVQLKVKASGKKRAKLNSAGKVKVNADVTFTPTGGEAKTQSLQVKLKKV